MAFSKSEISQFTQTVERFLENHRPPRQMRGELDYRARINGQSVEIYKLCPGGDHDIPGEINKDGVAKATYVKSRGTWKLYALGDDLDWRRVNPQQEYPSLDAALKTVERDTEGCFYG